MRLVLGICMVHYGYDKVVPHGALDRTGHYVASMSVPGLSVHVPYWLGYVSAITEFAGGILVIFGLLTRFVCFFITINMLLAFVLAGVHGGPNMYFYQLSLAANAFMLMCYGPGALALDRKLGFA
jgi:putative oxidoreductase